MFHGSTVPVWGDSSPFPGPHCKVLAAVFCTPAQYLLKLDTRSIYRYFKRAPFLAPFRSVVQTQSALAACQTQRPCTSMPSGILVRYPAAAAANHTRPWALFSRKICPVPGTTRLMMAETWRPGLESTSGFWKLTTPPLVRSRQWGHEDSTAENASPQSKQVLNGIGGIWKREYGRPQSVAA